MKVESMAPQNFTLIHESIKVDPELSHYSPILKAKIDDVESCSSRSSKAARTTHSLNKAVPANFAAVFDDQVEYEIPIWICGEPRFISGITNATTCNDLIQALIDDELNSSTADVAASRDLNDYTITEKWRDVEQALTGDTKILPIWIAWGCGARHEVKFKLKINKNKVGTKIADDFKRDYGDAKHHDKLYKQAEKYQREKTAAVASLLKRLIDQGESIKQQLNALREKRGNDQANSSSERTHSGPRVSSFLMESFLCDTLQSARPENEQKVTNPNEGNAMKETPQRVAIKKHTKNEIQPDDELFLVIDDTNDGAGRYAKESAVHVEYRQYCLNKKLDLAIAAAKVNEKDKKPQSTAHHVNANAKKTSISKKLEFDAVKQNSFNKRLIKYLSENINQPSIRHRNAGRPEDGHSSSEQSITIQCEIDKLIAEMYALIAQEEELMKTLSSKCERYRNQNSKYMTKLRLELCIDEVQSNLEMCAKEIIDNELELYRIQNEIREKSNLLFDLQRMVSDTDDDNTQKAQEQPIRLKNIARLHDNNSNDSGNVDSLYDKSLII